MREYTLAKKDLRISAAKSYNACQHSIHTIALVELGLARSNINVS